MELKEKEQLSVAARGWKKQWGIVDQETMQEATLSIYMSDKAVKYCEIVVKDKVVRAYVQLTMWAYYTRKKEIDSYILFFLNDIFPTRTDYIELNYEVKTYITSSNLKKLFEEGEADARRIQQEQQSERAKEGDHKEVVSEEDSGQGLPEEGVQEAER